jgi:magnesium-transporting ATPase (P-type)
MKLIDKINVTEIVKNHLSTLVNDNTKKPGLGDFFTFLFIPIIVAAILFYSNNIVDPNTASTLSNIIIVSLSIFIGLLFNVIVLIFDIVHKGNKQDIKNRVLKQLLSNIAFTVLLSIVSIILTLSTYIRYLYIKNVFIFLNYFTLTLFVITVLMILKRMHALFKNEIEELTENTD